MSHGQHFTSTDVLRLEIEDEPTGLVNLAQNPSGDLGSWGWVTPVPLSTLNAVPGESLLPTQLRYVSPGAVASYFHTEPMPITAGQYAAARWDIGLINGYYRARFEWLNASFSLLSSTTQSGYLNGIGEAGYGPHLAPASTAYVRLRFDHYATTGGAHPANGQAVNLFDVTVAKASTSGELDDLGYLDPVQYLDILGPTHTIKVNREELNVGTLTATILDADLDPSQASLIRPGKKVRLSALVGDRWEAVYTGRTTLATTSYNKAKGGDLAAKGAVRIELSAVDNCAHLSNQGEDRAVATINALPYILEGKGVPWNVNSFGGQVPTATVVAVNENASVLDQIAVTRDSALGHAWVDRNNVLRAYNIVPGGVAADFTDVPPTPDVIEVPNASFEDDEPLIWSAEYGTVSRSSDDAASGSHSMKVVPDPEFDDWFFSTDEITGWTPGRKYRVSFKARATVPCTFWAGTTERALGTAWETYTFDTTALDSAHEVWLYTLGVPDGTVVYFDDFGVAGIDPLSYVDIDASFSSSDLINEVMVNFLRYKPIAGQTEEIPYGPYIDTESVAAHGAYRSTFTIVGATEDAGDIQAYAQAILDANATPAARCNSLVMSVRDADEIEAATTLDLYSLVRITYADRIDDELRITGIEHTITPDKWLVRYSFADSGSVAAPTWTPSPAGIPIEGETGDITVVSPFAAGVAGLQVLKVGPMAILQGQVTRASGFSSSFTTVGNVPAGFRPAAETAFTTSMIWGGTHYQVLVQTGGNLLVRMSAANAGAMALSGVMWKVAES